VARSENGSNGAHVLIEVIRVRKTYKKGEVEVTPLDNCNLIVNQGEFVALMGPSGSGKSTMLNLVAGIDKPTAGRVIVDGEDITDWGEDELAEWRNRAVGYVFQSFNLMPVLTAYENVELPLLLMPLSAARRRQQVMTALELVGLADRARHYPRQLSGGQEQRVAIARALAADPHILLADEPTGALDRVSALAVMDLLERLNRDFGKTVLLVTHDPHVAERATRVLHLEKGEFMEAHELEAALSRVHPQEVTR
jgi:putative ABC transport system ATP-binding protein